MRTFSSTLALILAIIILAYPAGPREAPAQDKAPAQKRLGLAEPYLELQFAFANGFESAVRYIHQEMKAGRLDLEKLDRLAANKKERLQILITEMTKEYQATLIKLNAEPKKKSAAE